jgi:hypothetical protein
MRVSPGMRALMRLSAAATSAAAHLDHAEIKALVSRIAAANPTWGAPRIHAELLTLGIEAAERTVSVRQRPVFPAAGHATCSALPSGPLSVIPEYLVSPGKGDSRKPGHAGLVPVPAS